MLERMTCKKWVITEAGERLDKTISALDKELSRVTIQRLIEDEKVLVNGKVQKTSYKVKLGDKIELKHEEPKETEIKPENIPLDIIYEDNDIVVINKPKGLVVHPRKWKSKWYFSKRSISIL